MLLGVGIFELCCIGVVAMCGACGFAVMFHSCRSRI
jgi:hypothetical protein